MKHIYLDHVRRDPERDRWVAVILSPAGHIADVYGDDHDQARTRALALVFATRRPGVWALLSSIFKQ